MEKRELTAADVWAMFAETDRKMAETDRIMRENERKIAEGHRILDEKFDRLEKLFEDLGIERRENDRALNEKLAENNRALNEKLAENNRALNEKLAENNRALNEKLAENNRALNEKLAENDRKLTERFEALGIKVNEVKSNVVGIGHSNGEYAEEYFYNSLKKKMEFAGVHFDLINTDFRLLRKAPSGKRVEDQFDMVMINGEAAAIIEIKYKARENDPKQMVNQKVSNFRFLFPEYAKLKIYLGLGAFSFEKSVEQEAQELGIGLLKQVGETIEYETKWVRAY